ncbi:hypothetical protein OLN43_18680 [Acinetobacter baumannii]|jgi:hypothetical protein|uniref:hypothetical protein n=1 Tax=Acinetobacter baumannii TaxID=470 RepID=UPI002223D718|nr:hypothetical protein [Acinetobacter baumannii]MCW1491261.1 hypothetical protein [Acinetobacter baumannii]HCA5061146.1 hypothetical protein [Acinetobacter baumannii]
MNKKLALIATLLLSSLSFTAVNAEDKPPLKSLTDILQPASANYQYCRLQYENCRNGVGAFIGLKETWKCQVAFDRCRSSGSFILP